MRLNYPRTGPNKLIFFEDFRDARAVADNGGVIQGAPTIANGAVLDVAGKAIDYARLIGRLAPFVSRAKALTVIADMAKPSSAAAYRTLFDFRGGASDTCLEVGFEITTGKMYAFSAASSIQVSNSAMGAGRHQIAWSLSGTTCTFYQDGAADSAALALPLNPYSGTQFIRVGGLAYNLINQPIFATIYRLWIYEGALTAAEIADHYAGTTAEEIRLDKAQVFLPLKSWYYDGGSVARTENKGLLGGTATLGDGTTTSTFPTLVANNGMTFAQASARYLQLADSATLDLPGDFTFGCLLRCTALLDGAAATNYEILNKETLNVSGYMLRVQNGNAAAAGKLQFRTNQAATSTTVTTSARAINTGQVHRLFVVKSGTDVDFYVDDAVVADDGTTVNVPVAGAEVLGIGGKAAGAQNFTGNIHFPILFNSALTPMQIRLLGAQMRQMLNG